MYIHTILDNTHWLIFNFHIILFSCYYIHVIGRALDFLESGGGGRFSDAVTPDFITQHIATTAFVPGPGSYKKNDPKNSIYNHNADWTVNSDQIGK